MPPALQEWVASQLHQFLERRSHRKPELLLSADRDVRGLLLWKSPRTPSLEYEFGRLTPSLRSRKLFLCKISGSPTRDSHHSPGGWVVVFVTDSGRRPCQSNHNVTDVEVGSMVLFEMVCHVELRKLFGRANLKQSLNFQLDERITIGPL